jgi:hypothetical protein
VHDDLVLSVALASWTAEQYYSCAEKRAYQRDAQERLDQEFEVLPDRSPPYPSTLFNPQKMKSGMLPGFINQSAR